MGPPIMSKESMPTFNRIFILGGKGASEEEWREAFDKYGRITDVFITKNRSSGEDKGITYITFEKTSDACHAMEEMNGNCLPNYQRPLKVILASDKKEGSRRNVDEEKMLLRLFIMVPKGQTEKEVTDHFAQFGEIDYVRVIRDRKSGKSRGLGYVKYFKQFHGAKAFEECDSQYRAMFADAKPKEEKDGDPGNYDSHYLATGGRGQDGEKHGFSGGSYDRFGGYESGYSRKMPPPLTGLGLGGAAGGPMDLMKNYNHWDQCQLEALIPEPLTQEHVYRLFDLIPGLKSCNYDINSGLAYVTYSTPQCAAYAKDKVHGMEYPPGCRISVRFSRTSNFAGQSSPASFNKSGRGFHDEVGSSVPGIAIPEVGSNLNTLVESLQKATSVLQSAGITLPGVTTTTSSNEEHVRWSNVPLPLKKPFAPRDSEVQERLFIVSQPDSFSDNVLEDVLCRFGNLISAYFMPGKTYGYAKFADKESAKSAVDTLHAQQICGNRVKVMLADPPKYEREDYNNPSKKPRTS